MKPRALPAANDIRAVFALFCASVILGGLVNYFRQNPLPLAYVSKEARLEAVIAKEETHAGPVAPLGPDVGRSEMQTIVSKRSAVILDARPQVFFRFGHIPTSKSLPREDFAKQFQALEPTLRKNTGQAIVVYCSSAECQDSQMVAKALRDLGFLNVRVFRGGWFDWQEIHLPEEHSDD